MLSERSFNMQKHAPFCPRKMGKSPFFDPFKDIYGANEILFLIVLKQLDFNNLQAVFELG